MNETQIRQRLREAVGETRIPPDLRNRVEARLKGTERMKGGSLMFGFGRTASVVAAVLALLLVAAAVIGIRAWHDSLVNSRPASTVQNPTVSQYQAMVSHDVLNALSKQANACAVLGDACPTAAPRLAAALQNWLDDLNGARPPSRFKYVDAGLRRHVAACIKDLNAALAAYDAQDQKGMDAAISAGVSERDTFSAEVDAIRNSSQASASGYASIVRSDQAGLANCLACQTLAGPGQAPCNVGDDFCQNNVVVAMEDIDALQGDLVRNFAPAASAPKDARLQIDVWAADQALVAMDAAWSAHDEVSLQTARDAFSQAFTRVVSDLAAF